MKTVSMLILLLAATAIAGVVDQTVKLEKIPGEFQLADGPSWDGSGSLYIPDVKAGKLYRYFPKQNKLQLLLPEAGRISATYFNHGRLYLSDNAGGRITRLEGKEQHRANLMSERPNDLVVDQYSGTYVTLTKPGRVAYFSRPGKRLLGIDGMKTPNGITLSPDGQKLYVSAYVPKEIWVYDIKKPGLPENGRLFAKMDDGEAKGADGMTIDRAGNVYCAGATDIWIWSPSGKLIEKIACPERPINCTFGDQDMQSLYITGFGGLYRQRMTIKGLPPHPPMYDEQLTAPVPKQKPSTFIPYMTMNYKLDVPYLMRGDRKLLTDLFWPKGEGPFPALVLIHGGGWKNGYKNTFRALGIEMAKRGYVVSVPEYRLAGEAKFPAGIRDCMAAVRHLREHPEYPVDVKCIGVAGGSAGGHLAGLVATGGDRKELQHEGVYPDQSSVVQAAVVMAGPLEIMSGSVAERAGKGGSNIEAWTGLGPEEGRAMYELADAHLQLTKDDPPILFMTGEHDNPDRNKPTRELLEVYGIPTGIKIYKDGKHGCWNQRPWFIDMAADMDAWFKQHLK